MAWDRETCNEYQRIWKSANAEKVRESQRKYREANRDRIAAKARAYRAANPEKVAESSRKRKLQSQFNLTLAEYDDLAQNGCEICGAMQSSSGNRLSVDHDHDTGQVRGILCQACNVAIGLMCDNPDRLRLAVIYLERFEHVNHCD